MASAKAKKGSSARAAVKKTARKASKKAAAAKPSARKKAVTKKPAKKKPPAKAPSKKAQSKKASPKKAPKKPVAGPLPERAADPLAQAESTARKAAAKTVARKKSKPARSKPLPDLAVGPDELEFIDALERFRYEYGRPFPSWSEVLFVIKQLGYKK